MIPNASAGLKSFLLNVIMYAAEDATAASMTNAAVEGRLGRKLSADRLPPLVISANIAKDHTLLLSFIRAGQTEKVEI